MASLNDAPAAISAWLAAEQSTDPARELRAVLSPEVVMDFGGHKIRGVDAVVGMVTLVMPPGWLGDVEWALLPRGADGRWILRATGRGGAPIKVFVPGAPAQSMEAMDLIFTLDGAGLIVGLGGQAHHFAEPGDIAPPMHPGDAAPDFVLPDVQGNRIPLRQQDATATVVAFISNHCPFSAAWHERLQRVARDYAPRGVHFLNINSNDPSQGPQDAVESARKLVARGHFAAAYLIDQDQMVARRWGARRTPEVFVLDARRIVVYHGAPDADSDDESVNAAWIRSALDQVLAGALPSPAETPVMGCPIKWRR